jgi:hypothetical protein
MLSINKIVETLKTEAAKRGFLLRSKRMGRCVSINVVFSGCPNTVLMELGILKGSRLQLRAHEDDRIIHSMAWQFVSLDWAVSQMSDASARAHKYVEERQQKMLTERLKAAQAEIVCPDCQGKGNWIEGNRNDGDTCRQICRTCHGWGRLKPNM